MTAAPSPAPEITIDPSLSVIICAYTTDRWDVLNRSIDSVVRPGSVREVIVVVDHNTELLDRLRRAWPGLTIVPNRLAPGLSGARNTGLELATGDVIGFLDDDATASSSWAADIRRAFAADRDLAVLGGGVEPVWKGGRPSWFPDEFAWVVGCSWTGMPPAGGPVRNVIGANMAFRRRWLAGDRFAAAVGRTATKPMGCEETELCIRLRQRDPRCRVHYRPEVWVRHEVSADRSSVRYYARRCWAEGLSKATMANMVGPRDGLATERRYVAVVLPKGVLRGCRDAVGGDRSGLGRAAAIVGGLAATTAGYGWGVGARRLGELRTK